LGVHQAERHPPGDAKQDPLIDLQVLAQPLDVRDQLTVVLTER
jgi:hypothetical protein